MTPLCPVMRTWLLLPLLTAPATAQFGLAGDGNHAHATLYTRAQGGLVRAAIEIEIDAGWHLYHHEKGHPDAIGLETTVTLSGAEVEWSEVRFPEPEEVDQSYIGEGVWIWGHAGTIVLHAAGRAAGDPRVTASIEGLTCEDLGSCVKYSEELVSQGPGPDALFADFPADLLPTPAAPERAVEPAAAPSDDPAATKAGEPDGETVSGEIDGFGGPSTGKAHATLFARVDGEGVVRAAIDVEIEEGWHLYHTEKGNPDGIGDVATVTLGGRGILWNAEVRFPDPYVSDQSELGPGLWIWAHEGWITLYATGRLQPGASVEDAIALAEGLTCEDSGSCIPYSQSLEWEAEGDDAFFDDFPADLLPPEPGAAPAAPPVSPDRSKPGSSAGSTAPARTDMDYEAVAFPGFERQVDADEAGRGLLAWLLLAFLAGIILNVMPCVLPVISIKVLSFVQQAGEDKRRVFHLGVAFAAGILVVFLVLAAVAVFAGQNWGEQFQSERFVTIMIAIVFAFALSLFGVFELGVPKAVGSMAGGGMKEGLGDAFFKGMLATVLATPCSGPFLGSTLTWTLAQPSATVFLVFTFLGLGMASPYILLTANPRFLKFVPKPGAWMETFKQAMGFVLLATVLYMLTFVKQDQMLFLSFSLVFVALGCWWWGRFASFDQSTVKRLATLGVALTIAVGGYRLSFWEVRAMFQAPGELAWVRFEPDRFLDHLENGDSVFIDFTADWCPNCKWNERTVYESEEVRAALEDKDIVAMKADITHENAYTDMIERLMDGLGASSIPFNATFPGDDPYRPITRPDVVTRAEMLGIFDALPDPDDDLSHAGG